MPIPRASHTQFLVLNALLDGEKWGREVRAALRAENYASTHASFYEMIDRMEQSGVIESWFEERDVEGQKFNEKSLPFDGKRRQRAERSCAILRTEN